MYLTLSQWSIKVSRSVNGLLLLFLLFIIIIIAEDLDSAEEKYEKVKKELDETNAMLEDIQ